MDELTRKRQTHAGPELGARPEDDLARRERAAQADDHTAEDRDAAAETDDKCAALRDRAAAERDVLAEVEPEDAPAQVVRDRARKDREGSARDRASAGADRNRAQGDRSNAQRGRVRASDDRDAASQAIAHLRGLLDQAEDSAEDMILIAQAQGYLMQEQGLSAPVALINVAVRAIHDETALGEAARRMLNADAQPSAQ